MSALVAALMLWLTQNAPELHVPPARPQEVRFVSRTEILRMTHGDELAKTTGACYMGVVYLDTRLDVFKRTEDRSVLLHELVHYAQNNCAIPRDMTERVMLEDQAYAIQARYLYSQLSKGTK